MTKNILLACENNRIDVPLRRSLAHLVKSCEISIAHNGYELFEQLSGNVFDLFIIDFEISDFDSLELVESLRYIDPGVPIILMLEEAHKAIWDTVHHLEARPIMRPFKPLRFLRLVDKLLHQHLNYYRKLTENLKTTLDTLRTQTVSPGAFLVEETGEILIASGHVKGIPRDELGKLVVDSVALENAEAQSVQFRLEKNYGLYVTLVAENLYLALVSPIGQDLQESLGTWQQVDETASQVSVALYDQSAGDIVPPNGNNDANSRRFIPLKCNFSHELAEPANVEEFEQDESTVNWGIISNNSNLSSRMENYCQLN
jgi:DNA-binding NarL/FixJ family response regulator